MDDHGEVPTRAGLRTLVAGVGNIFLGDDGFGSEVARGLVTRVWPEGVRVADYGIGGIHLAYDLLEGYDLLVLIDTVARGCVPGTLAVIEVGRDDVPDAPVDAHGMDPVAVLANVERLGGALPRTLVVGCEPADTSERLGLSAAVEAAVEPAMTLVQDLVVRDLVPEG